MTAPIPLDTKRVLLEERVNLNLARRLFDGLHYVRAEFFIHLRPPPSRIITGFANGANG